MNIPKSKQDSLIPPKTSFIIPKVFNNPKTTGENILNGKKRKKLASLTFVLGTESKRP